MPVKAQPVPTGLSPALVEQLAAFHGKRADVAQTGLSRMRSEDLQTLGTLGIIKPMDTSSDTPAEIEITEYGQGVIAGSAAHMRRTGPRQVFGDLSPR